MVLSQFILNSELLFFWKFPGKGSPPPGVKNVKIQENSKILKKIRGSPEGTLRDFYNRLRALVAPKGALSGKTPRGGGGSTDLCLGKN